MVSGDAQCFFIHAPAGIVRVAFFLYGNVLGVELPWLTTIGRPREVKRLPVTLSPDEVRRIFLHMEGEFLLIAQLLYGTGLRILEAMRLRVKDIDFTRNTIIVREAKGNKDRVGFKHAGGDRKLIEFPEG